MGLPAARVGDMHVCPMVTPGVPPVPHVGGPILPPGGITVLIGGVPAARMGDMCTCVGPPDIIAKGSTGVFIMGMPAARMGDITAHGGSIVVGLPTVLIGEVMPSPPPVVMPPMVIVNVMLSQAQINSAQNLRNGAVKLPQPQKAILNQTASFLEAAAQGIPFCEKCLEKALENLNLTKEEKQEKLKQASEEKRRIAEEDRKMKMIQEMRKTFNRATESGKGFCKKCGG